MTGGKTWRSSVVAAINRIVRGSGSATFSRGAIRLELLQVIPDTGTKGRTPDQTLSRVLQELRDEGQIEFVKRGEYRAIRKELR
jgi:putative restriction endonuclease